MKDSQLLQFRSLHEKHPLGDVLSSCVIRQSMPISDSIICRWGDPSQFLCQLSQLHFLCTIFNLSGEFILCIYMQFLVLVLTTQNVFDPSLAFLNVWSMSKHICVPYIWTKNHTSLSSAAVSKYFLRYGTNILADHVRYRLEEHFYYLFNISQY